MTRIPRITYLTNISNYRIPEELIL